MEFKEISIYILIIIVGVIIAQHMNVVVSESMEPVMYRGDIVLIDNNPSYIQVGDIVVYHATWFSQPVIHRIIQIKNTTNGVLYTIKGDNNPNPDPEPVYPNQVISKVVNINNKPLIIPKIGFITLWIRGL